MSQSITRCDKCSSTDFTDLNPEVRGESKTLVSVKATCNKCGHEFEYRTFSNSGQDRRNRGMIW